MKIGWLLLPFNNPEMAWPIGTEGVRVTISLLNRDMAQLINKFWAFNIGGVTIPTGAPAFLPHFAVC
jgi:simple sugar transport system permease protein